MGSDYFRYHERNHRAVNGLKFTLKSKYIWGFYVKMSNNYKNKT